MSSEGYAFLKNLIRLLVRKRISDRSIQLISTHSSDSRIFSNMYLRGPGQGPHLAVLPQKLGVETTYLLVCIKEISDRIFGTSATFMRKIRHDRSSSLKNSVSTLPDPKWLHRDGKMYALYTSSLLVTISLIVEICQS